MNKKNSGILILTLALAIVAGMLIFKNKSGTLKKELKDFAISDTASVDKIFLANKTGQQVTLVKTSPGEWKVNGKFNARPDAIKMLLQTMMKLEVKNPVAKAGLESVLKTMSSHATKVEIYQHGNLSKTYYVGGATQDQLGTFMLMDQSSTPFVMYLPGLNGYLTPRYFADEILWKSRAIFQYKPDEVKSVEVNYPVPAFSFKLNAQKNNQFTISNPLIQSGTELPYTDSTRIFSYLSGFSNLQFELAVTEMKKEKRDSILASPPLCMLTVTDFSGKRTLMKFFYMAISERSLQKEDEKGQALKYDLDRMYALIDGKDFVIVQHFVFDKVLRSFDEFVSKTSDPDKAKKKANPKQIKSTSK